MTYIANNNNKKQASSHNVMQAALGFSHGIFETTQLKTPCVLPEAV